MNRKLWTSQDTVKDAYTLPWRFQGNIGLASPPDGWVLFSTVVSILFYGEIQVNPDYVWIVLKGFPFIPNLSFDCSKGQERQKTEATATE